MSWWVPTRRWRVGGGFLEDFFGRSTELKDFLGGGFKHVLFSSLFGEDSKFD